MSSPREPLHVTGEVLVVKKVGAYRHLTLAAPGIAERYRPGTFVAVSIGDLTPRTHLARRSLWITGVRPTGSHGPTIELVVEPGGVGSTWLADRRQGDRVELTGPLGRPFALPKQPVACLLVGEGYAAGLLFPLAERLRARSCTVTMLLGAQDEPHLLGALDARRAARAVTVVTADGSVGRRGTLADALPAVMDGVDVVYGAGTHVGLHAVAATAEQFGAWSQVAVEVPQPCGTGLCQGCALPVVGEDGVPRLVRACTDGPVIRGDRVRWAELTGTESGPA
ncbi:iron-sulfur cluster-binding protein [Nocardioides jensenii]|uniref:iron-sulfur cluster-binding protein n=1 Tax=Nocardioides jensenii TaxID=1843 RepID=UPI0009E91758|nr:hypothetical protein [Nocardioides jensenii]